MRWLKICKRASASKWVGLVWIGLNTVTVGVGILVEAGNFWNKACFDQ